LIKSNRQQGVMLNFQKEIINDLLSKNDDNSDDSNDNDNFGKILIMAKGLGLNQIIQHICYHYSCNSEISTLIFILNLTQTQEQSIIEYIIKKNKKENKKGEAVKERENGKRNKSKRIKMIDNEQDSSFFKIIHAETNQKKRREIYKQGGLISISNRIMIIDLLGGIIPINQISNIIILNTERTKEYGLEPFIIFSIKESNPSMQILGFTEEIFDGNPERILKVLQIREMIIWPRFHQKVKDILDNESFKLNQLIIEMPEKMKMIQIELMNILNILFREISKINPGV